MPLPPSGPISMSMINVELALPATQVISLNQANVRALAQVPAGVISLSNFYGKSSVITNGFFLGGLLPPTGTLGTASYKFQFPTETDSAIASRSIRGQSMSGLTNNTMISAFGASTLSNGAPSIPLSLNNAEILTFSSEAYSVSPTIPWPAGFSNSATSGASSPTSLYWKTYRTMGGTQTFVSGKLNFSTWAVTTLAAVPNVPVQGFRDAAAKGNDTKGYFFGGFWGPPPALSNNIDRMPWSVETLSSLGTWPGRGGGGTLASPTAAYAVNLGSASSLTSQVVAKVLWATDTVSSFTSFQTRALMSGVNNTTTGYMRSGRHPPGPIWRLDYLKLNFSNDTSSAITPISAGGDSQNSGQPRALGF